MPSPLFDALLVAERHRIEQGHHDGSRDIYVVWTRKSYTPGVCDECLEYAYQLIEDKATKNMNIFNASKLTENSEYLT